ncbi:hypothetical protein IW261DRAFT_781710 [Armillaria novae-zelandiae]|uniref:Uncharacterized protein n=1 Tax=Armillaria novae-zelandiae TaxID=153914 RepID=A0AA39UGC2_9AGAR|nr:hypothetical protein IW261DRAFT_781710 [Armillaria novae-zelandiae]
MTSDIALVEGFNELQDGRDAEEPAFLPTPPADEPTITSEEISSALNQEYGIPDDTSAGDDSKQQEAKYEPSVPETVDHDATGIHEENPELVGIAIPVIVEPAVVHTGAATDIVAEPKEEDDGREVNALAEIPSQEVIPAADNPLTVIPQTQTENISSVVDEVPSVPIHDSSAASKFVVDTNKTPSEESPIVVVDEMCTALVNDGPANAIDISYTALPHGSPTLPSEEELSFEPPLVVAVDHHADLRVDNSRVDSSVPTTNEIPAVVVNDSATAPGEQGSARSDDDSPSIQLDTIATDPVDAPIPIDEVLTVDADMVVDVLPQPPNGIDVVETENTTDTPPIVAPANIGSSPPACSGSPAPADPHTPPTQLTIQTGFSPLFTPHAHIKRRPPGLMTTPPSSEGYSSDDVRSPPQRDGDENRHGPDSEQDHTHDQAGDQITVDSQVAVAGMEPSESTPIRIRRDSLTRTPQVVPYHESQGQVCSTTRPLPLQLVYAWCCSVPKQVWFR